MKSKIKEETRLVTEQLHKDVIGFIQESSSIYILSAFVMESGVRILLPHLHAAAICGADIKILTGDYLYVTQPKALRLLLELPNSVEIRLWKSNGQSFHPKAFLFSKPKGSALLVGSSNLSRSALSTGIEWNLLVENDYASNTFREAEATFISLFYKENTVPINVETVYTYEQGYEDFHRRHTDLVTTWTEQEEQELTFGVTEPAGLVSETSTTYQAEEKLEPRIAQIEALEALETTVEEGYKRAMVVMATGLGKTYLAAFFAGSFKRILFVAHREEIIQQAKRSFSRVMPERSSGIYNGTSKDRGEMVFASIFTLSMQKHLTTFTPDEFDLIIFDEFHHASAASYQKVISYFNPAFMLGITTTPERTDGNDIFAICDGNVAYEIHFIQAIQKGWLSPFNYYGVYDKVDYSQITWLGASYDTNELETQQLQEDVAENVFSSWEKHKESRTIGFCSSIRQADYLSIYFNRKGVRTVSLHSRSGLDRTATIKQLEAGDLDVIFTVDLFNEGVDIPSVDTLLFARPTESLIVFTQQVGRGLRLHPGKTHCTIIDLIGNYRNADVKLSLLGVDGEDRTGRPVVPQVPEGCMIDLDTNVIDLLSELIRKRSPRKERVFFAYRHVKEQLGSRPSYLELHLHGTMDSKEFKQIWKSYAGFLWSMDELSHKEAEIFYRYKGWLEEVERTSMQRSYKMVVLDYMLSRGHVKWTHDVTPTDVAPYFHHYLTETPYRKRIDFSTLKAKALWEYDEKKVAALIAEMPMTKWSGSSNGMVRFAEGIFGLDFDVLEEDLEVLYMLTKEICEYRLHVHFEKKASSVQ